MIEGEIKERERRERDDRWIDMWMDGHVDRETDKLIDISHYVPCTLMDTLHTFI